MEPENPSEVATTGNDTPTLSAGQDGQDVQTPVTEQQPATPQADQPSLEDIERLIAYEEARAELLRLRAENEGITLRTQRIRNAGHTPAQPASDVGSWLNEMGASHADRMGTAPAPHSLEPSPLGNETPRSVLTYAPSEVTQVAASAPSRTRKQPDIPPFNGKKMDDAILFLNRLSLAFDNNEACFQTDKDKIVYGLTYVRGEAEKKAMREFGEDARHTKTWKEFKDFIMNTVQDPVNRQLTLMCEYEDAIQGPNEQVGIFAARLENIEKEFPDQYTEPQRMRHLLAKLRQSLRTAIVESAEVPQDREALISRCERIENARSMGSQGNRKRESEGPPRGAPSGPKFQRSNSQGQRSAPARGAPTSQPAQNRPPRQQQNPPRVPKSTDVCNHCHKQGHWAVDCRTRLRAARLAEETAKGSGNGKTVGKTLVDS